MAKKDNKYLVVFILGILAGLCLFIAANIIITNNIITTSDKIIIQDDVLAELNELYINNENEWSACLDGYVDSVKDVSNEVTEQNIIITDIDKIYMSQYKTNSRLLNCEFAFIHSHPAGTCRFSLVDIVNIKDEFNNGLIVNMVMCGEDKIVFNMRYNFNEKKINI